MSSPFARAVNTALQEANFKPGTHTHAGYIFANPDRENFVIIRWGVHDSPHEPLDAEDQIVRMQRALADQFAVGVGGLHNPFSDNLDVVLTVRPLSKTGTMP